MMWWALLLSFLAPMPVLLVGAFLGRKKKKIDDQISYFHELELAFKNLERFYEDRKENSMGHFLSSIHIEKRSKDYRNNYIQLVDRIENRVMNKELLKVLDKNEDEMADTIFNRPKDRVSRLGEPLETEEERLSNKNKRDGLDNRRIQLMSECRLLISEEIKKLESFWSIITYKPPKKSY